MKISFERRLILLFALIFIGIIILGIFAINSNRSAARTNQSIEHTKEVIAQSERIVSFSKDIIIGGQRYIITGDSSFLQLFYATKDSVNNNIFKLKILTSDNPVQRPRIDSLKGLMENRIDFSEKYIHLRKKYGFAAASGLIETGRGQLYMELIRRLIAAIERDENDLLHKREIKNNRTLDNFNRAFYALIFSVFTFLIAVFFYILDIFKKRNKAEQEIRQANNFLDTILENIPNMIFVKDADELRFVRFNKAGEKLLGYSRNDLLGKNDYDFFPKEQADFFTGKDKDVINQRDVVDIAEEPINTANGERILHTKKIPIVDDNDSPIYLLGISEDITERKKADERLKELNERFFKIFNTSPVAMGISDAEGGQFIEINDAFENLFGLKKDVVVGKSAMQLKITTAEKRKETVEKIMRSSGRIKGLETELSNAGGQQMDVIISMETMLIDSKKYFLTAFTDITERKKTEQQISRLNTELGKTIDQLQSANQELEAFSYSVSHDLRAPLRIIDGYAGILAADYKPKLDEEGAKILEVIRANARRMGQLIDDLLNLSRLGRKELSLNRVNMSELVRTTVIPELQSQSSFPLPEIKIDTLYPVDADRSLIQQVWTNLIANAVKYSRPKEKPYIEIGSEKKDREVIYYVKDNGVGFDMQYSDKLFGVFQRLHKMTEFEGTGVGLAIVNRIITKHNGKVWADAKVNEGATFFFSLPL